MATQDTNTFRPETRITQAHGEIGQTDFAPGTRPFLAFVFLLLVMGLPLMQLVFEARSGPEAPKPMSALPRPGIAPVGHRNTEPGFFNRLFRANAALLRDIHRYEDGLDDEGLLAANLLPVTQGLLYGAFRLGNERAYAGQDGWLFFRPGVDYLWGRGFLDPRHLQKRLDEGSEWRAAPQPDPVLAILHFQAQLARRGIRLLIVPTPVKGMIHPEKFSLRSSPAQGPLQNLSWKKFLAELKDPERFFVGRYQRMKKRIARGDPDWTPWAQCAAQLEHDKELLAKHPLLIHDPTQLLLELAADGQEVFLRSDTHWRPEAMEQVAADLAALLKNERGESLPAEEPPRLQAKEVQVEHLGDLAVLLRLPDAQGLVPPERVHIHSVLEGDGLWRPDRQAATLFLGDSYANIYALKAMGWGESAGLVEQLSAAWGRPLDAMLRNDAGAYTTREMLQREQKQGRDRLAGKSLVIWQFSMRELLVGDWRLLDMTPASQASSLLAPPAKPLEVEATVLAVSHVPRPDSVPYKDHVCSLLLGGLRSLSEGVTFDSKGRALAYAMCMRDKVWTPVARYRQGERVRLRLGPLDEPRIEGLMRSELEGLEFEDHAWARPRKGQKHSAEGTKAVGLAWPEWTSLGIFALLLGAFLFLLERKTRTREAEAS